MFGWGKRQPDARPNAAAALHPAPTLTGDGRLEESPPLPIDGLGEDPLLAAEPCRLCDNRGLNMPALTSMVEVPWHSEVEYA